MYLARRTWERLGVGLIAAIAFVSVIAGLAVVLPGSAANFHSAFFRWLIGLPLFLILWAALDIFGARLVRSSFWQRLTSPVRIAALVAIVTAVAVALVAAVQ